MSKTSPPVHSSRRSGCFRRLWLGSLGVLLLLAAAILIAGYLFTRPQQLTPLAEQLLSEWTGAQVRIASARMNRRGDLLLEGLHFQVPDLEGDLGELLHIRHLELRPRRSDVFRGRLGPEAIEHVLIEDGVLQITENPEGGYFNYERFSPPRSGHPVRSGKTAARQEPAESLPFFRFKTPALRRIGQLPTVELRRAAIHFGEWKSQSGYRLLERMPLEGLVAVAPDAESTYQFRLVENPEAAPEAFQPARLSGHLDLAAAEISLAIEHYRIDAPSRHLLPRSFRTWWEDLNPSGSVPSFALRVRQETGGQLRLQEASLDVQDLAITLNFFGLDPAEADLPRLERVEGRITVEGEKVFVQSLEGQAAGTDVRLTGWHDLNSAGSRHLELKTGTIQLADDPEFARVLGPQIQRIYERFSPAGPIRLALTLNGAGGQTPPHYDAVIHLLGSSACYQHFPYPLTGVTGRIAIRPDHIELLQIAGTGPSGASVQVDGRIKRHKPHGGSLQLDITGSRIPLDEPLLEALAPSVRQVIESFLSEEKYQQLLDAGLIRTRGPMDPPPAAPATTPTTTAAASPVFELGGIVPRFQLHLERQLANRPGDPEPPAEIRWELDPTGLNVLYAHWPYPAHITSGIIRMLPEGVTVENVKFEGLAGGGGTVHGSLQPQPERKALRPELFFENVQLPLHPLLLWTVPAETRRWLETLHPQGALQATGRVFEKPGGGDVDFHFRGRFEDAAFAPHAGRFPIGQLQGEMELQRGRFQLLETLGHHQMALFRFHGEARWAEESEESAYAFHLAAERLPLQEEVLDLLPPDHAAHPSVAALLERYRPSGQMDVALTWTSASGTPDHFQLIAQPRYLTLDLKGERIELELTGGRALIEPGQARLEALRGRFPQGNGQLEGLLQWSNDRLELTDLQFSAQTVTTSPLLKLLLPEPVSQTLDHLQVQGALEIVSGHFQHEATPARTRVKTLVAMKGFSLDLGIQVQDLHGHAAITADQQAGTPIQWQMGLAASRLKAADRLISPLSLALHTTALVDVLALSDLRGSVQGGTLTGNGLIDSRDQAGRYRLDLRLVDAAFEPIVDPSLGQPPVTAWPTAAIADVRRQGKPVDPISLSDLPPLEEAGGDYGLLSASLHIEGSLISAEDRRGRGRVQIRDTSLIHRPLSLAIAQAANLMLPTARSFDRASARYLLEGHTVYLDLISFEAPTFALAGDGQMRLPSTQIDLRMVTRAPSQPRFGVFGRAFRAIKDELITVQVTGTLDTPRAQVSALGRIRRAWSSLFELLDSPAR